MGNSIHCKIVTPEISSWNFAHVITSARLAAKQILVSVGTVEASLQNLPEIPGDFFDCPVLSLFFSRSYARSKNRWTDFHALWLKRRVSAKDDPFGVRMMGDHIWGK